MSFVLEQSPTVGSRLLGRLSRSTGALGWVLAAVLAALLLFTATPGQRGGGSQPRCAPCSVLQASC